MFFVYFMVAVPKSGWVFDWLLWYCLFKDSVNEWNISHVILIKICEHQKVSQVLDEKKIDNKSFTVASFFKGKVLLSTWEFRESSISTCDQKW